MGPKGDSRLSAHKAAAAVAEGGLAEGNLMEGVEEGQAQLGADGAGPEQVLCQLLSAEGATPGGRDSTLAWLRPFSQTRESWQLQQPCLWGAQESEHSPLAWGWVKPMASKGEVA